MNASGKSIMAALRYWKIAPEEKNPVNRFLIWAYHPFVRFVLRHRALTLVGALALMLSTVPVFLRLGSEFMPPLYEGSFLYMPITLPGASIETAHCRSASRCPPTRCFRSASSSRRRRR